jgi:hypothetical protein
VDSLTLPPGTPAMTDPLSVAAGIAGLISLSIQVTDSLVKFYTSYKGQEAAVTRTTENLESLLGTFRSLSSALQNRAFRPDEQDLIKNIESCIYQCDDLIQERCQIPATSRVLSDLLTFADHRSYLVQEHGLLTFGDSVCSHKEVTWIACPSLRNGDRLLSSTPASLRVRRDSSEL